MQSLNIREISTSVVDEENNQYNPSSGARISGWVSLPASLFTDYVDDIVEAKLQYLLRQKEVSQKLLDIDDAAAKNEIKNFIVNKKRAGITKLSLIEISTSLKLPIEQAERIMNIFEKEGKIQEANE